MNVERGSQMVLLESLKTKQEKIIENKVIEFAEQVEPLLVESAENGYSGYAYKINDDNPEKHIMRSENFTEKLEMLMDGVKVKYEIRIKNSMLGWTFYEHYIQFHWNE